MIQIQDIRFWFNPKTGKFQEKEIKGGIYVEGKKEVEVSIRHVAYFDFSNYIQLSTRKHYVKKAKEFGIKEYSLLNSKPMGKIKSMDDLTIFELQPGTVSNYTDYAWLRNLPKNIIAYVFTDGRVSVNMLHYQMLNSNAFFYLWNKE